MYIAGPNILEVNSLIKKIRLSSYGKYLRHLIKKNNLFDYIFFTGALSEEQMCNQYLQSNVFVCPSSIENSPNSLGEAQLLGMPCIAAYVGGVPDMMDASEEWMYRFEEIEMLAEKICLAFKYVDESSLHNQRERALIRHNKQQNSQALLNIYQDILNK